MGFSSLYFPLVLVAYQRYTAVVPIGAQILAIQCKKPCHVTYYPDFARLLNHALQRQDRSASWLAQRLGVSPSTVGRWLNDGVRPGSPKLVAKIADILGRDADIQAFLTAAGYGYTESTASSDSQPALNPSHAAPAVSSTMR